MLFQKILKDKSSSEKIALILDNRFISYRQLVTDILTMSCHLKALNMPEGSVIAICLDNCYEGILTCFAAFNLGYKVAPIRKMHSEEDVLYILSDCMPMLFISDAKFAKLALTNIRHYLVGVDKVNDDQHQFSEFLIPIVDIEQQWKLELPDAHATILYTSGSTGKPKGVIHSQEQYWINTQNSLNDFKQNDTTYVVMSMYHAYAFGQQLLPALARGATIWIVRKFDAETALKNIFEGSSSHNGTKFCVSNIFAVPSVYAALARDITLLNGPYSHQVRYFDVAGDILPQNIKNSIEKFFNRPVRVSYGMTEILRFFPGKFEEGTPSYLMGKPLDDSQYQFRVIDPTTLEDVPKGQMGELCVKSVSLMLRYTTDKKNDSAYYMHGGFFRTGDIVSIDVENNVAFHCRVKRALISPLTAQMISPTNVEAIISSHPSVKETIVMNTSPLVNKISYIAALVVLKPLAESEQITANNLFLWLLASGLSEIECPTFIKIKSRDLPRLPTGKLDILFCQRKVDKHFSDDKKPSDKRIMVIN